MASAQQVSCPARPSGECRNSLGRGRLLHGPPVRSGTEIVSSTSCLGVPSRAIGLGVRMGVPTGGSSDPAP